MLWEIDIFPAPGQPDRLAQQVAADAADLGIAADLKIASACGYLIQCRLARDDVEQLASELFADGVVEHAAVGKPSDAELLSPFPSRTGQGKGAAGTLIYVLLKPGVMDPVALSAEAA